MDGRGGLGSDDNFLIRQEHSVSLQAQFWCWARWARLSIEEIVHYSS